MIDFQRNLYIYWQVTHGSWT